MPVEIMNGLRKNERLSHALTGDIRKLSMTKSVIPKVRVAVRRLPVFLCTWYPSGNAVNRISAASILFRVIKVFYYSKMIKLF